ncbi:MAG: hypothetical protein ACREFP_18275 [Acetobacteraceae bacterium]
MSEPVQELTDECRRQEENCGYTSTTFTIWLRFLHYVRVSCLVAPVMFGAIATWKVVAQNSPVWAAVFTLLATVIPPAYAASRTSSAIEQFATLGGEFTNLRDRFRQAATITSKKSFTEFDAEVASLMDRLEKARHRILTPPEWCFWLARRKHKAGHYRHDYDEQLTTTKDRHSPSRVG